MQRKILIYISENHEKFNIKQNLYEYHDYTTHDYTQHTHKYTHMHTHTCKSCKSMNVIDP